MADVEGPGLVEAIARLATMRSTLDAADIVCTWDTPHGIVSVEIDEDGVEMYVNGQLVPTIQGPMPS